MWASVPRTYIHSSASGNQFYFLLILLGNQAGCKYENSVIDLTNARGGSFLSSELSALREEKDKQDIDSFIWEYANSMEKQPV